MTIPRASLLVSPHRLFRECLAARLAGSGLEGDVAQADDLVEAAEWIDQRPCDLLLLDVSAANPGDCDGLRRLTLRHPDLRAVVLGGASQDEDYLRWVESGALGYLLQESTMAELCEAVDKAMRGEMHCPPGVSFQLFRRLGGLAAERRRREQVESLPLSPRELEVLQFLAARHTNREIAGTLCISIYTVKNHVHHILDKLEVSHRKAAVERAFQNGWLRERRRAG